MNECVRVTQEAKGTTGGAQVGDTQTHPVSVLGVRTNIPVIYLLAWSCSVSCPSSVLETDLARLSVDSRAADRERGGFFSEDGVISSRVSSRHEAFSCLSSLHPIPVAKAS